MLRRTKIFRQSASELHQPFFCFSVAPVCKCNEPWEFSASMSTIDELVIRQAIHEATSSMSSDLQLMLKQAVEEALREALPAELRKAISPVFEELRTQAPTGPAETSPGGPRPPLRRKLSSISNSADVSTRRRSLQISSKTAVLASRLKAPVLPKARTESMSGLDGMAKPLSGGHSEQLGADKKKAMEAC